MRLVGASNAYIRGPFVIEGLIYGIASAIITLIIFYPLTLWLGPVTESFFGSINLFDYYVSNFGQLFVILVGSGMILGAISSYLAVRRYLRV
jgi:cell division transport system permease protein